MKINPKRSFEIRTSIWKYIIIVSKKNYKSKGFWQDRVLELNDNTIWHFSPPVNKETLIFFRWILFYKIIIYFRLFLCKVNRTDGRRLSFTLWEKFVEKTKICLLITLISKLVFFAQNYRSHCKVKYSRRSAIKNWPFIYNNKELRKSSIQKLFLKSFLPPFLLRNNIDLKYICTSNKLLLLLLFH